MNIFKKPQLWASIAAVGAIQIFTVNTAPYSTKAAFEQSSAQRVPANVPVAESTPEEDQPPVEAAEPSEPRLIVMAWNVNDISREGGDYDRAAIVLADADIIVLHDVDLKHKGKGLVSILANLAEQKAKTKFCRASGQSSDGARTRAAFIWRESSVGFLDASGTMHENCPSGPVNIRQEKRMKAGIHAAFYSKNPRKVFDIATLLMDKKPKADEVSEIVRTLGQGEWPSILAADFRANPSDSALSELTKAGYLSALDISKRNGRASTENFWYKKAQVVSSGTIDLYERFADVRREDLEQGLSDRFPIAIEIRLAEAVMEDISTALVSKSRGDKKIVKSAVKKKAGKSSGKSLEKSKGRATSSTPGKRPE